MSEKQGESEISMTLSVMEDFETIFSVATLGDILQAHWNIAISDNVEESHSGNH